MKRQISKFEQFFRETRELEIIDSSQYIELTKFIKYLGFDKILDFGVKIYYINNKVYISLETAEFLMKTKYNKDSSQVVQYHKDMGLTGLEYTMSAKALNPIVNTFNMIGSALNGDSNNKSSSNEEKKGYYGVDFFSMF